MGRREARSAALRELERVGLAELALSGCSLTSDHLYLFPNGSRLDDEIEAALEIGVRLQASRGSMSLGESKGGLPPDRVVEEEEEVVEEAVAEVMAEEALAKEITMAVEAGEEEATTFPTTAAATERRGPVTTVE